MHDVFSLPDAMSYDNISFFKKFFQEHYQMSNGLDPDQEQCSVGPDLGTNCLQSLSADV